MIDNPVTCPLELLLFFHNTHWRMPVPAFQQQQQQQQQSGGGGTQTQPLYEYIAASHAFALTELDVIQGIVSLLFSWWSAY